MRLIDADALKQHIDKLPALPDGNFAGNHSALKALINMQPTIEPEPHWIPCSECLPNRSGCYLVWRPHFWSSEIGMSAICYFDGHNTWHDSYGVDFERTLQTNDVTAWMPLPDPYEGE